MNRTLIFALALLNIAAVVPVVMPAYTFTTTTTIDISNQDLQPSYLTAVELSFAAAVNNTFTLEHISPGATNILVTGSSATMQSLIWYAPKPLFLKDGDSLVPTNTDGSQAVLKLSVEKYKN